MADAALDTNADHVLDAIGENLWITAGRLSVKVRRLDANTVEVEIFPLDCEDMEQALGRTRVNLQPHERVWTGPGELERSGYLDSPSIPRATGPRARTGSIDESCCPCPAHGVTHTDRNDAAWSPFPAAEG